MTRPDLPQSILFSGLALLALLAACGKEPREAPTSGDEVKQRAIEA